MILVFVAAISIYEYVLIQHQKKILSRYEYYRRILYETSEKISQTNDKDEIYSIVLDAIVLLIPNATKGSVLLLGADGKFYFNVGKGYDKELENITLNKEEVYLYRINEFKEAAIINNPKEFDQLNTDKNTIERFESINALDIYCTISAPIYINKELIGLINVDSDKRSSRFTDKDLELMNQIKCELELALKNAFAQNKLKYLANYDELTGLMNRRTLKKEFNKELDIIRISKLSFCLVMIDIDEFKFYNDTYGHYFGDVVLKKFTSILNNQVRKTDVVARFAGDEFVILFKNCDYAVAENKMKSITEEILSTNVDEIIMNFSYGICEVISDINMNFDAALANADIKMYENKKQKENKELTQV
jgi:diguanylate cyclase (GGDEF)-like protein